MAASEKLKLEVVFQRRSVKKTVFENFANQRCFPVNFCKIFKNTCYHRAPVVAPSEKLNGEAVIRRCSVKKVL